MFHINARRGLLLALCLFATACSNQMADQQRYEPLEPSSVFEDGRASRDQVPETVARGELQDDTLLYTGKTDAQPTGAEQGNDTGNTPDTGDGANAGDSGSAGTDNSGSGSRNNQSGSGSTDSTENQGGDIDTGSNDEGGNNGGNEQNEGGDADDGDTQSEPGDSTSQPGSEGTLSEVFPFAVTQEVMERGQVRYNIYCTPCHDRLGTGNGMVVRRGYSPPPTLHSDRMREQPVGHFYDVITNGWGRMPSYAAQIPVRDRWAIVAYIRALQLSQNATLDDVPADQRGQLGGGGQ